MSGSSATSTSSISVKPFVPSATFVPASQHKRSGSTSFDWEGTFGQDLIDHDQEVITIDGDESVEAACELLISSNLSCLVVTQKTAFASSTSTTLIEQAVGLFDWADANSFLTLLLSSGPGSSSGTTHCPMGERGPDHELEERTRKLQALIKKSGNNNVVVPVKEACDLSGKNPLVVMSCEAPLLELLSIFSTGTHRVLLLPSTPTPTQPFTGVLSDRHLLRHISNASRTLKNTTMLSQTISQLKLANRDVVKMGESKTVLDAMRVMSEEGVSSLAVVDETTGCLAGAVSVVDIGKFVIPSPARSILSTTLSSFVRQTSAKIGATTGEDHVPVYSVPPASTLSYTISKLLATKSHRTYLSLASSSGFPSPSSPSSSTFLLPSSPSRASFLSSSPISSTSFGGRAGDTLGGVISIVDILGVFAKEAGLVSTPTGLRDRRRRASSTTSSYSGSSRSGGFDIRM